MPSRPVFDPYSTTRLPGPVALALRQLLGGQQADAHRVDQRVVLVGVVELDLAAHVGHADTVAVGANAGHHAGEQVPLAVVVQLAEAQRVEDRDRPRAHREDVAEDAADAGRRALERLDRRRVVVALDLEGDGEPVTHVDHAGVLPRALEHPLAGRRKPAEQQPRVLVAAVLAPEQRVDGQLEVVRIAAQQLLDTPELPVGQPEGAMQRLWRDGIQGLRNATPRGRSTGYTATGWRARSSMPCSRTRPSVEPSSGSTACSGCGISAATLPRSLVTQAIEPTEPLGFSR